MRFVVVRPYDLGAIGYAPRGSKAHAVEVVVTGEMSRRTMCGLIAVDLRPVLSGFGRRQDWTGVTSGRCRRCQGAIDRRLIEGDEMDEVGP